MSASETFVLVGGGYASSRASDCLRQEGFEGRIVLISEEPHLPYSRPPLCKKALVSKIDISRLPLRHAGFYEKSRIDLMLGKHVVAIDRAARRVRIDGEPPLDYDRL